MSRNRFPLLVSAAVIARGTKILVGQRRRGDRHALKWEFPGGKVEPGETPEQALVRELREELAIECKVGRQIAQYRHDYPKGVSVVLLFYVVADFEGEPTGKVFEQIQWAERTLLPELDFLEGDIDFVQRLARGEFEAKLLG
ncbi:MAG TPA: (deoxy)nucleoside triphosphate pyrophosphohydrolase [Bryobacteraceae bacterium]|nr:(deoxy)nucleoside triphosphate pyrophosphohydrolase [Bryobacteraceae bacterium]